MSLKDKRIKFEESELAERDKLYDILYQYFQIGDSNCYHLTKVEETFGFETVIREGFVEFDKDTIEDIVTYITKKWNEDNEQ